MKLHRTQGANVRAPRLIVCLASIAVMLGVVAIRPVQGIERPCPPENPGCRAQQGQPAKTTAVAPGQSASGSGSGRPFVARPASRDLYDVGAATGATFPSSFDGTEIYIDTWLPTARPAGPNPPQRLPIVLSMTPYARKGHVYESMSALRDHLVRRGYGFSVMHTRGTGLSGGCLPLLSKVEGEDGASAIAFLAGRTYSDGAVGTFGASYDGGTQIATATTDHQAVARHLKAMVVGNPAASWYDFAHHDGVPSNLKSLAAAYYTDKSLFPHSGLGDLVIYTMAGLHGLSEAEYMAQSRLSEGGTPVQRWPARMGCQGDHYQAGTDLSGDFTDYYQQREHRTDVEKIQAATFMYHGHLDKAVSPVVQAGLFDRIKAPKFGIFGEIGHRVMLTKPKPEPSVLRELIGESHWELRPDYFDMVVAWYDRYLKSAETGVEGWPTAQVQGNDGLWRSEPNWPATGGPVGHLVLGDGTLGTEPSGQPSSSYTESSLAFDMDSGLKTHKASLTFSTPALKERLEITGIPIADLWLKLNKPDAHIAVKIQTFDAVGKPIESFAGGDGSAVGFRSMRHLEPFEKGRFAQTQGKDAPQNQLFRTVIRFRPVDLVVPKGGRVVLSISGGEPEQMQSPSRPSDANAKVTVQHDCTRVSALRFVMPQENPDILRIPGAEPAQAEIAAGPGPMESDGGGIATDPVCGQSPTRDGFEEFFGPTTRTYPK